MLSPGGEVPWAAVWSGVTALVPLLLTGVRHHPPGRTDKNLCRCFGAPACRVFPDHLMISNALPQGRLPRRAAPQGATRSRCS